MAYAYHRDVTGPIPPALFADAAPVGIGVLVTGLLLGIRHGIDWDHIAAITDITSTTAGATHAESHHARQHEALAGHDHPHGGAAEALAHGGPAGEGPGTMLAAPARPAAGPLAFLRVEQQPVVLGTLYALGHAAVVAVLGLAAILLGAALPDWIDPIMGRIVGLTLIFLGVYVFLAVYQYARHGGEFRLRSRWMLVFDTTRYAWRRIQARIHGHAHVDPLEASSYGPRTAFGVGLLHGIGAETASQALLIAAVGGAASAGLGVPMLFAFIIGLVVSNTVIVILTATGFIASQWKTQIYLAVGILTGIFSLWIGFVFLFQAEALLPNLENLFRFIGG
jgi:high-affinity nickel-transport protein